MLTEREKECTRLASNGLSAKEIAKAIGISQKTVEEHLRACREKLGAKNTCNLISIAHKSGLLSALFIACSVFSITTDYDVLRPSRARVRLSRSARQNRGRREWEIIA